MSAAPGQTTHHAAAVAMPAGGVLIRGASGSGKSTLALQLLQTDAGARLVADDRAVLVGSAGRLLARPAPGLEGLLEIRGIGIVEMPHCNECEICLIVDILPVAECLRLPGQAEAMATIESVVLPRLCLPIGFHAGPSRLAAALQLLAESPDCLLRSGVVWSKLSRRSINAAEVPLRDDPRIVEG